MILGLDIGSSATKLAGFAEEKVLFTHTHTGTCEDFGALISEVLKNSGFEESEVEALALTGVGAESARLTEKPYHVKLVSEIEATGEGGLWLAGLREAVVVSVGTGTSLVLARDGVCTHIGGSGVGSGTVRGLAKKLSGITGIPEYFALAEGGHKEKIDLQIKDLFSGTETLPPDLTASNLAKCAEDGTEADWAAAVINLALEVAGSHAALACGGYGVDTVVVTGGLSQTGIARQCYEKFDRLYKPAYIIPEFSGSSTAIGAARRLSREI